jgi:hypothetical protein
VLSVLGMKRGLSCVTRNASARRLQATFGPTTPHLGNDADVLLLQRPSRHARVDRHRGRRCSPAFTDKAKARVCARRVSPGSSCCPSRVSRWRAVAHLGAINGSYRAWGN